MYHREQCDNSPEITWVRQEAYRGNIVRQYRTISLRES